MPLVQDLSQAQIAFQISGQAVDQFEAIRYRGTEGLCQLYRFEIDLAAAGTGLPLNDLVGKTAVLSINTPTGERWFHGIVGRLEITGETVGQTYYRAELVPTAWLLTHRYHSRIFQKKSSKDIITQILTDAGIASDHVKWQLSGDHPQREYCVQYRETDYNFIARLMEEEGIWWCFEHSKDKHVLIIADSSSAYAAIEGEAKLQYRAPSGLLPEADHVFRFRLAQSVRPGAVVLNDYNFEKPAQKLEAKDDAGRDQSLEFCDFPGEFTEESRGTALAKLRKEEFQALRIHAAGQAICKRLSPGRTFELTEHSVSSLNGQYLITSITHEGKQSVTRTTAAEGRASVLDARLRQSLLAARADNSPVVRDLAEALLQIVSRLHAGDPTARRALTAWLYHAGQVARDLPSAAVVSGGSPVDWLTIPNLISDVARSTIIDYDAPVYQNSFECIPATVTYRPPRVTPWPVMRGTQTARVVGPQGEEIHTDNYGRVLVQFDWDREGSEGGQAKLHGSESSCWIRVAQGWAGWAYGMMFIPRVGQEVIVDFLEGDPDKPIIVGRVFNADHMPPYELPKEKTKSVIKTHTSKGGGGCNEIRFEDLKGKEQLFLQAQRQMDTRVKASHFHSVGGSYHVVVGGEKDGDLCGEYREKVFKAKHVHIKGEQRFWVEENEGRVVGKDQSIEVQGARSSSVGGDDINLVGGNEKLDVTATAHIKAADVKVEASGTIELVAGGSSVVITGAGVYITGPMVYINSGSGPPVGPVEGGVGPAAPEEASGADSSQPGKNVTYSGPSGAVTPATPLAEVPGHEFPDQQPPVTETSWIEIEIKDKEGKPVAHEPYRVKDSANRVFPGALDENGFAHIDGVAPGMCEISLPNRDISLWKRA